MRHTNAPATDDEGLITTIRRGGGQRPWAAADHFGATGRKDNGEKFAFTDVPAVLDRLRIWRFIALQEYAMIRGRGADG
ncbi:hypothetical protein R1CP_36420 (plasmid) [Rhodococcus opacus]|uniref:Uncharacterized protein n=1 Tax=Rhodococcus opacus TaxID=37919 RepID=A0A1B1KH43_RHOOP|nr:hypothetical protein R1CP_36420 [Rhodococcus opacus]